MGFLKAARDLCSELDEAGIQVPALDEFRRCVRLHERPYTQTKKHGASVEEHESYGSIRFSRVSGGDPTMYGSRSDMHPSRIRMVVQRSKRMVDMEERHHPYGESFIELEMTASQFAEAITNHVGIGTPCTLRRVYGDVLEPVQQSEQSELRRVTKHYKDEVTEKASKFRESFSKLGEILAKKTIGKGDRTAIRGLFQGVERLVSDTLPFYGNMLEETAEKMGNAVLLEAEAVFSLVLQKVGLSALKGNQLSSAEITAALAEPTSEGED